MIDYVLAFIAPHPCLECGKLGSLLCNNCKYNIESEPFVSCIVCGRASGKNGICTTCRVPYSRAWCVGERSDALLKLIDVYKFERARSSYKILADLVSSTLPHLPLNTVVVPIPTVNSHIRQRGYDHTELIAKRVARTHGLKMQKILGRKTTAMQRGATRKVRITQAKQAFGVQLLIQSEAAYLLIDDIVTTGSTLKYATQALRDAGAKDVWVAVVARQISTE